MADARRPRTVLIIQARMGSIRLPGKVMLDLGGAPVIERVIERARLIEGVDEVVVATTTLAEEAPLVDHVRRLGAPIQRGPIEDVLGRYVEAARATTAAVVVRVTADCPLLDPGVASRVLARFHEGTGSVDYCSNTLVRTFPRGLDVEAVSRSALEAAHADATSAADREHVTPFVYRHPDRFRIAQVTDTDDRSHLRLTLDTSEDYDLLVRIYDALGPDPSSVGYADILALLERNSWWAAINRGVVQKPATGEGQ